jgi:hypothetical protein
MPAERTQRRIDAFLDEADLAASSGDWSAVAEKARAVLAMDPENEDDPPLLRAAEANRGIGGTASPPPPPPAPVAVDPERVAELAVLPVVAGLRPPECGTRRTGAEDWGERRDRLVCDRRDRGALSALLDSYSNSACSFDCTSTTNRYARAPAPVELAPWSDGRSWRHARPAAAVPVVPIARRAPRRHATASAASS